MVCLNKGCSVATVNENLKVVINQRIRKTLLASRLALRQSFLRCKDGVNLALINYQLARTLQIKMARTSNSQAAKRRSL